MSSYHIANVTGMIYAHHIFEIMVIIRFTVRYLMLLKYIYYHIYV